MNPNVRRIPFNGPPRHAFDGPVVDLREPLSQVVTLQTPVEQLVRRPLPELTTEADRVLAAAAAPSGLEEVEAVPTVAAPVLIERRGELTSPTRYAGLYDLFGGVEGFKQTLSRVPLGGVVRALAENAGVDPQRALMLERGGAILTAGGAGAMTLLAAANALNGDDRPVVVMQTPGR